MLGLEPGTFTSSGSSTASGFSLEEDEKVLEAIQLSYNASYGTGGFFDCDDEDEEAALFSPKSQPDAVPSSAPQALPSSSAPATSLSANSGETVHETSTGGSLKGRSDAHDLGTANA